MRLLLGIAFAVLGSMTWHGAAAQTPGSLVRLQGLQDIARYIGTYPCSNGILRSPVLLRGLSAALGRQYGAYRQHMALAGCGAIEQRGAYLLMDVSQLHVGGYSSMILIRQPDQAIFVYWLDGTVSARQQRIYGPRPFPVKALQIFAHDMNTSWGHVACFTPDTDSLVIDLTRRANQDTGECRM